MQCRTEVLATAFFAAHAIEMGRNHFRVMTDDRTVAAITGLLATTT
jgi:hypothetical protein